MLAKSAGLLVYTGRSLEMAVAGDGARRPGNAKLCRADRGNRDRPARRAAEMTWSASGRLRNGHLSDEEI
jgi:hypothetical protein